MTKALTVTHPQNQLQQAQEHFIKAAGAYLATVQRDRSPVTFKSYTRHLGAFTDWIANTDAARPIRERLLDYRHHLREKYTNAKTINLQLSAVRGFFKWLHEQGLIDSLPTAGVKNLKTGDAQRRSPLTPYQEHDVLAAARECKTEKQRRDRCILILALNNGLRVSEIANANIEDFGEKSGKKILYLLRKGYTDKSNAVVISPPVYQELQKYIGSRTAGALFPSTKHGGNMTGDTVSRILKKQFRTAGIDAKNYTAHSTRHTFAVKCIKAGVDLFNLQQAMNHQSPTTTTGYLHGFNRYENPAEEQIAPAL